MSKRTVINADEELVIKGKLTIEGNVTQIETTQQVTNLEGNVFTINSDGSNTSAVLALNSNGTVASLTFDDANGSIVFNKPINLGSYPLTTTGNITAPYFIGNVIGTVSSLSNHDTDDLNEGTTNLYFTDARVRGNIGVIDAGGDGSLTYSSANGNITYVGPSATEVRAHFSATDGVEYSNVSGVINLANTVAGDGLTFSSGVVNVVAGSGITVNPNNVAVDSTVVRTSGNQSIAGDKTFTGTTYVTGNIEPTAANTYNLGSWANHFDYVFANVLHAEYLDLEDANISDIHNSFYTGTASNASITRTSDGLTFTHNTTGAYYAVNAGNGLDIDGNGILSIDTTVITTAGGQTINGNLTLTGNLIVVNIDSQTQTDSVVTDKILYLNVGGAASPNNSKISVEKTGANVYLEYDSVWKFTNDGSNVYNIPVTTTDLNEGSNLYFTTDRANTAIDNYLIGGDGVTYSTGNISIGAGDGIAVNADNVSVDATVLRTSGDQNISGIKNFTGELVIPSAFPTQNNTIYVNAGNTAVFANVNGVHVQLTSDSDVGQVEDVGTTGVDIYAGSRDVTIGNNTIYYHGIRSIDGGTYTTASVASNVITVEGNISAIRGSLSTANVSGYGSISYSSANGVFSYTGISDAQVRGLISASGLISYDSANGIITTSADNYSGWTVQTDSGSGAAESITSGEVLQIIGGTNITVTNTGNVITVTNDNVADIESVSAGDGLTGGGNNGNVTIDVGAGAGIIVNADNVAVNVSYVRSQFSANGDLSYNAETGVFSFTNDAGDIEGVTAGNGLIGGGTSGTVTLDIGAGLGINVNSDNIAVNMNAFSTTDLAEGANLYFSNARVNAFIQSSITTTDIDEGANLYYTSSRANSAMDAYLVGGSGLTYSSGTFAVGAGNYILVGANDVAVDATTTATASKIVARDSTGNVYANYFVGTATAAQYADLAENYLADGDYLPGTVLVFGGSEEVTAAMTFESTRIAGVVTTQPAHVMNSHLTGEHVVCIALRGRVPVKVKGVVRKGDVLVSAGEGHTGYAVASLDPRNVPAAAIVGKAISDKLDAGPGVVEALI